MSIQKTEEAEMHPEFQQALARQRIEELHSLARAPRAARGGSSPRISRRSLRELVGHGRPFRGQLQSEGR